MTFGLYYTFANTQGCPCHIIRLWFVTCSIPYFNVPFQLVVRGSAHHRARQERAGPGLLRPRLPGPDEQGPDGHRHPELGARGSGAAGREADSRRSPHVSLVKVNEHAQIFVQ